jgi:hypothetical protein
MNPADSLPLVCRHTSREANGWDFYWSDKLGVTSLVGQGGNVWEYNPKTQKETQVWPKK